MRIAVLHDWAPDLGQELTWKDGLAAAIRILGTRHELQFFTVGAYSTLQHPYFTIQVCSPDDQGDAYGVTTLVSKFKPDVILHWADLTRPHGNVGLVLGIPQAICFAGGDTQGANLGKFDITFVESKVYEEKFKAIGENVVVAFGTNTALFSPIKGQAKHYDALFPATFCEWKRHGLFVAATRGLRSCAVGYMYEERERYCWEECETAGQLVLPHVSAECLRRLYAASRVVVVPSRADGGSQRTVLEAMAMDVPLVVCSDSDKTSEYLLDAGIGSVVDPTPEAMREAIDRSLANPKNEGRSYVMSKWTEHHYADILERGLKAIL